jgi:branched-chain amino acid transport system ATP-binding protein
MTQAPILSVIGLHKRFGGIEALDGIDLAVNDGETVGLIGPNGAGKTALINTITGFYRPTSGRIEFLGRRIDHEPLHRIGRLGISRTFQNIRLFKRMTVLENVMVANKAHAASPWKAFFDFRRRAAAVREAMPWLELMQLTDMADQPAAGLSYGDARRLEIARALAGRPALLLLDEPAAGMNETETMQLVEDIRIARANVRGVLLIEHDMSLIRSLSDRIVAMDYGRKIADGSPEAVLSHPEVKRAYLGDADG